MRIGYSGRIIGSKRAGAGAARSLEQGTSSLESQKTTYSGILKSSSVYSIGTILGRAASFFFVPLYTYKLSQADYGVLELLDLTVQVLAMFFVARFSSSVAYFYAEAGTKEQRLRVISSATLGALALAGAFIVAGCSLAIPLSNLVFQTPGRARFLVMLTIAFGMTLPMDVILTWFRAEDRSGEGRVGKECR